MFHSPQPCSDIEKCESCQALFTWQEHLRLVDFLNGIIVVQTCFATMRLVHQDSLVACAGCSQKLLHGRRLHLPEVLSVHGGRSALRQIGSRGCRPGAFLKPLMCISLMLICSLTRMYCHRWPCLHFVSAWVSLPKQDCLVGI